MSNIFGYIYIFVMPSGMLVAKPGIEPMSPTLETWCLNHLTPEMSQ